jgi:uncharacterized protein DUF6883
VILPDAANALIPEAKLRQFALNEAHLDNGGKAKLFEALGYTQANWRPMADDIKEQHLPQDAVEIEPNDHWTR